MKMEWVKRVTVACALFVAGVAVAGATLGRASTVRAAAPLAAATPKTVVPQFDSETGCVSAVPRAWGKYKGGSAQSGLAFQAPDGTLRFLTNLPCGSQAVVALKIIRTGNGN